jgi:hypothetical protein
MNGRIPPNMHSTLFRQLSLRRARRSKLTFLERLEFFDLTDAIQNDERKC